MAKLGKDIFAKIKSINHKSTSNGIWCLEVTGVLTQCAHLPQAKEAQLSVNTLCCSHYLTITALNCMYRLRGVENNTCTTVVDQWEHKSFRGVVALLTLNISLYVFSVSRHSQNWMSSLFLTGGTLQFLRQLLHMNKVLFFITTKNYGQILP